MNLHKPTQTLVSLQAANTYRHGQKNAKDLKTELTMEPLYKEGKTELGIQINWIGCLNIL